MRVTQGTLPLVMGAYAKNFGVELYMCGRTAYTNGKMIVIPALDISDPRVLEMAYGYVAHECGHIKYTDWDLFENTIAIQSEFIKNFFNALEDCRVEYYHVRDWPGMTRTFDFLIGELAEETDKFITKLIRKKDISSIILMFCMYYVRFHQNEQLRAEPILKRLEKFITKKYPQSFYQMIVSELDQIAYFKTSGEIYKKVLRLTSLLKNYFNLFEKIDTLKKNDELNNESSDEFNNSNQSQSKLSENCKRLALDFIVENNLLSGFEDLLCADFDKNLNFSKEVDFQKATAECPSVEKKLSSLHVNTGVKGFDFGAADVEFAKPNTANKYLDSIWVNSNFAGKISDLIHTYTLREDGDTIKGFNLDVKKFAIRHYTYDYNVFYNKRYKKDYKTHIQLLIDNSGSMKRVSSKNNKPRFVIANEVAYTLATTISNFSKVKCDVTYFPGESTEVNVVCKSTECPKDKIRYFEQNPKGSTPLAQALMYSMMNCDYGNINERNIILVVTDGEPDDINFTKEMLKAAKKSNIEVYAIYIAKTEKCKNLFEHMRMIEDTTDIYDSVYELLELALYNSKRKSFVDLTENEHNVGFDVFNSFAK